MEVELLEVRERVEEVEHVAGRVEAHLEEEQRLDALEHGPERVPRAGRERTPAQAAERERGDPRVHAQLARYARRGVHPPVVLRAALVRADARVLRAERQLAHAPRDDRRAREEGGEARAGGLRGEPDGAEEVEAGRGHPRTAGETARLERYRVVPEVVKSLIKELRRNGQA